MSVCVNCERVFEPNFVGHNICSRSCNMRRINADRSHQAAAGARGGKRERPVTGRSYAKVPDTDDHVHRVVAAVALGRPLALGEVVHHEDRNKRNNALTNLIVFPSQAVHARHHKLHYGSAPCDCPGIRLGGDAR
jgi:hypothetical protein